MRNVEGDNFKDDNIKIIDYNKTTVLLQSVQTEYENNKLILRLKEVYHDRMEITRGGSVAVEAIPSVK